MNQRHVRGLPALLLFLLASTNVLAEFPIQGTAYQLSTVSLNQARVLAVTEDRRLVMQEPDGSSHQLWLFYPTGGGFFRIYNVALGSSYALDGRNGEALIAPTTRDDGGQYWRLTDLGTGHYRLNNGYRADSKSLAADEQPPHAPFLGTTEETDISKFWELQPVVTAQNF